MKAFSIILLLLLIASLSGLIHIGIVHASSSTLLHVNHGASSPFQNYISDSSGNLVHLTGINYGDIPSGDPRYSNALSPSAAAANIKADGFNAVRLVVEWGAVETGTSSTFSYNLDSSSTFYARLQALTGSPNHLYVIIKLHADSDSSTNSAWGTNLARILGSAYCNPSTGTYYSTKMADSFYNTAYTSQYSAQQHFQQLWNQIASITSNNQYVVGYDFLNEPTRPYSYNNSLGTCTNSNQYSESDAQIRSEWHARINDLIANLRCSGVNTSTCSNLADNRMYFIEEAPFFSYYGGSGSLTFTPYTDTTLGYDNTISSVHFYRDEYPYYPNSGSYIACSSNPSDLASFWGNTATSSNNGPPSCTTAGASTVPLWAGVAQSSFPNQAFDVGEYGNIFDTNTTAPGVNDNQGVINQYGTSNYDWIVKSTNMFTFTQGTVGNTYYAQGSDVYPPANPNWQTILAHSPDLIPYATQGSINLAPGASTSVPALITGIDGFSGTVSFSATSSYSGITTTFTSNSMTISSPGGTASNSLSITVSSSTPTGSYTVTMTGASGALSHAATINVQVSTGGGGGGGGSIASGSLVTMADGSQIPVQNVNVGDQVTVYNVPTGYQTTATVSQIRIVVVNATITLHTTAAALPLRVDVNPKLKLWVISPNGPIEKPVTMIQSGDQIYNYNLHSWVTVTDVTVAAGGQHTVYDITTNPTFDNGRLLEVIANGYPDCTFTCKEGPTTLVNP